MHQLQIAFATSWEKKKLLVTSNFFFSHNVFYSIRKLYPHLSIFLKSYLHLQLNWKSPKSGEGLTLYHSIPTFNDSKEEGFRKLWEMEKMLVTTSFFCSIRNRNHHLSNNYFFCLQMISNLLQSNILLCGRELTHCHTMTPFDAPRKQAFWKHCGKRKNCS